jgi:hypothetical protein
MTQYVVARTAKRNSDINGRTLYLKRLGFWTLDIEQAVKFANKTEMTVYFGGDAKELRVEEVA